MTSRVSCRTLMTDMMAMAEGPRPRMTDTLNPTIVYDKVTGRWKRATEYVASYSAGNQAKLVKAIRHDGRQRSQAGNRHASGS